MAAKSLFKSIKILSCAVFCTIFLLALFSNEFATVLTAACILLLFTGICLLIQKCSETALTVLFCIGLVLFTAGLLTCGMLLRVHPAWDFGRIYYGALDLMDHGRLEITWPYYLESLNNLFPTLWITALAGTASAVTGIAFLNVLVAFNCVSIALSVLFLFHAARIAFGARVAFMASLLCFLSPALYGYSSIVYTDTLSMPFLTMCLLLCILGTKKRSTKATVFLGFAAGLAGVIGYLIKPTAAFPLIAMVLLVLLSKRHNFSFLLWTAGGFALFFALWKLWLAGTSIIDLSDLQLYRLPPMHYLRMGLITPGGYNGASHGTAADLPDAAARTAQAVEEIKQLLQNYGFPGFMQHLKSKLMYTWNDGMYFAPKKLAIDIYMPNPLHRLFLEEGDRFPHLHICAQGIHFAMLASLATGSAGYAFGKKDRPAAFVLWTTLLGVAVFLIFWETRSRYIVNCIPLFMLLMAASITNTAEFINTHLIHKK